MIKFICGFLLSSILLLQAQEINFSGKVRDINTNLELSDVNIYIKGLAVGTTTDVDGKFLLTIPNPRPDLVLVFDHVAYDTLQISLKDAFAREEFYLNPNLLQTNRILVEANKEKSELSKDLPQAVTILNSVDFAGKGYIDAGDLLRIDQSVQVEEELSGKKTISMRGGNPEDVVVTYNGIKMNSNYDNIFDFSMINLEDIEQIEIIKGSNTALFGPDAFSGVVNIIPKTKPKYTARFIQKFGSYDNGDWSLQLNQSFDVFPAQETKKKIPDKLHVSYNQRRSGSKRPYSDNKDFLKNSITHQLASVVYELSRDEAGYNTINAMYMHSKLKYDNNRLFESVNDKNQIASIRYTGNIGPLHFLNLSFAYQRLDNSQFITDTIGTYTLLHNNKNYFLNLEKTFNYSSFTLLTAYQFEDGTLDFTEERNFSKKVPVGLEGALLNLTKHGAVAILKVDTPTGSDILSEATIDASLRYDNVINQQRDIKQRNSLDVLEFTPGLYKENRWENTTVKFSTELRGSSKDLSYSVFMSTGNNVKFPTMFHQLSLPSQIQSTEPGVITSLSPEYNKSTEVGLSVLRETKHINKIDGWQIQLNYFSNVYENKFRSYYVPNVPVAFYDNVPDAAISGFESNGKLFMYDNKVTAELGASKYFISEKAAFPFKSDTKYIANLLFNYRGYYAKFNWFKESEQIGWFRDLRGFLAAAELPAYANIDLHLGKQFDLDFMKVNLTFSARNILDDDTVLYGIAIRDRRYYMSFGLVY